MERGFLQAHSYSVGTSIEKDDFINENFVPKDTFVFVGYRDNLDLADAAVVDSGMYACVYLGSFDDEIDFAKKASRALQRAELDRLRRLFLRDYDRI